MTREDRETLQAARIQMVEELIAEVAVEGDKITALCLASGREHRFDTLYSALGAQVRPELAWALGAKRDEIGALIVDEHQRTSLAGL